MTRAALLLAVCACGSSPEPTVSSVLSRPVVEWKLARAEWNKIIVAPYTQLYDDYARAFDASVPALEASLTATKSKGERTLTSRPHYAGDPELTRGQARTRWALPVQYPALVAKLGDAPIDAVFVRVGNVYKAIVGIDTIVVEKTRALDASCAHYLETLGTKACQTIAWAIADAALRGDRARLSHSCSLATSQCAP